LLTFGGSGAWAAGEAGAAPEAAVLEEIIVTAEKRSERAVDVPISVASISGATLQKAGVTGTMDLQQAVPGLRLDESGSNVSPSIRGIGSVLAGPGANANVAIYIDGFYEPNVLGSDFELLSISSVDVLKGPQGTLFGRNATGGAILVTTREPTQTPTGEVQLQYGSFNREKASMYLGGGLTPTVAADLTGYYERGDGYVTNTVTGADAANFTKFAIRPKVVFNPTDEIKFTLTYEHRHTDDPLPNATSNYQGLGYANIVPGTPNASGSRDYTGNLTPGNLFNGDAGMLRGDIDLGFGKLTSYTMYRAEKSQQDKDYDGSPLPVFAALWTVRDSTLTQEFNLAGKAWSRLDYVLGAFFYQNVNRYVFNEEAFGSPEFLGFTSRVTATSYALFGDATYEVADNLFFTAGLRGSQDHADGSYFDALVSSNNHDASHTWGAVTPRAVLRYKLTPQSNVYASFSEGYKSGIIPIQQTPPDPVSPEKVNAYEVGYKIANSVLSFDAAGFYYKYRNLQVQAYHGVVSLTENAARSTIYGFDSQLTARFDEHFSARAGAAYTHARYDSFPGAQDYIQDTNPANPTYGTFLSPAVNAGGNQMLRTPEFTGTLGLTYATPLAGGDLALNADLYATSNFFFDPVDRYSQGAYQILNLRATWTDPTGHWSATVYGTNVTDSKYRVEVLTGPFAIQQAYGEPAAVGGILSFKF
jgi:iron complex outermembrane receptor protein